MPRARQKTSRDRDYNPAIDSPIRFIQQAQVVQVIVTTMLSDSSKIQTDRIRTRAPIDQPISRESSGDPNLVGDRAAPPVCDH